MQPQIEMGSQARCKITGFQGTVTARCEYLHATTTIQIQPKLGEDGKYQDAKWFDIGQLEPVED